MYGAEKKPTNIMSAAYRRAVLLTQYYLTTRGCGHTHAAVQGVSATPEAKLLVQHRDAGRRLGLDRDKFVTIDDVLGHRLRGLRAPLVVDNDVLIHLLHDLTREIDLLTEDRQKLEKEHASA